MALIPGAEPSGAVPILPAAPVELPTRPLVIIPKLADLPKRSHPLWDELTAHICKFFYNPDLDALEIALSCSVSHWHKGADPSWLFFLGPSGGDKTSIIINCCLGVQSSYLMGDITPKTFLSGYTGNPNASLLNQIGSGILVFKDFTTFLSKRAEEQAEIASQLREIFDGYWKRNTGKGIELNWTGKMTVIAAATPALERKWGMLGELGERFLQVRLARKNGIEQAEYAQKQSGMEEFISKHMRELATRLLKADPAITYPPPKLNDEQRHRVSCLAEIVAHSRGKIARNIKGEIIGLPEIENSSRASKELNSLVAGHAALFRKQQVDNDDMRVAARVALNSIPAERYLVLSSIAAGGGRPVGTVDLLAATGLAESSLAYIMSELVCLKLIIHDKSCSYQSQAIFNPEIGELWKRAFQAS